MREFVIQSRFCSKAKGIYSAFRSFMWTLLETGPICIIVCRPSRTREQEKKYHAMIGDIAKNITFDWELDSKGNTTRVINKTGKRCYTPDIWKALLVHKFEQVKNELGDPLRRPGELILSLDGSVMVSKRPSTADFTVPEGSEFIEFLYCEGIEMGIKWPASSEEIAAAEREWVNTNRRTVV